LKSALLSWSYSYKGRFSYSIGAGVIVIARVFIVVGGNGTVEDDILLYGEDGNL